GWGKDLTSRFHDRPRGDNCISSLGSHFRIHCRANLSVNGSQNWLRICQNTHRGIDAELLWRYQNLQTFRNDRSSGGLGIDSKGNLG
ncbi:hypothetical protein KEM48_001108, partial [Puccinia striiformis f. sp. tritici PST-130]